MTTPTTHTRRKARRRRMSVIRALAAVREPVKPQRAATSTATKKGTT